MRPAPLTALAVTLAFAAPAVAAEKHPAVIADEFIYETAPFPSCHASTVAATKSGLVAAWFGGKKEGADDVCIWLARREAGKWTEPVKVADGITGDKQYPCWNPVLFEPAVGGPGKLLLFYKVGPSPSKWWGMLTTSETGGKTWSPPTRLP